MIHRLELRRCVRFVVPALALASATSPLAAAPQQWLDQFGSSGVNALRAVASDGAGAFVMAGETTIDLAGPNAGIVDVFVQKRDLGGNVLWQRQYGSAGAERELSIVADGAGGMFVAGTTTGDLGGPAFGEEDAFLMRLDDAGNLMWIRQLGTGELDKPTFVTSDGAGGAILGGFTDGDLGATSFGNEDAWIARFDAAGVLQWLTQFGTFADDRLEGAALDGAGGLILGGSTRGDLSGPSAGGTDAFRARMDLAGNLQAIVQFGTPGDEGVRDVIPDGAGGAFLAGATPGDISAMHIDAALNSLWSTTIAALSVSDSSPSLAPDGAGGVYVLAEVQGLGLFDVFLVQLDGGGTLLHTLPIPGTGIDYGYGITGDGAGGLIAVGRTEYGLIESAGLNEYLAWVGRYGPCDFDTPFTYCVGEPNSTGQGASISSDGNRYVANNDFALAVSGCPSGQVGLFLMATAQASTPFGDGTLCVGGNVSRLLPAQVTDVGGDAALQLDVTDPSSPASQIAPGSTWNFQFWYRDSASSGAGFNLSNGLSASFCP